MNQLYQFDPGNNKNYKLKNKSIQIYKENL